MTGYFRRCGLQFWSRLVRILLVDASPTIRNLQKNALKQLGHTDVIEAADGIQALAVFVDQSPDLAICGLEHAEHGWNYAGPNNPTKWQQDTFHHVHNRSGKKKGG